MGADREGLAPSRAPVMGRWPLLEEPVMGWLSRTTVMGQPLSLAHDGEECFVFLLTEQLSSLSLSRNTRAKRYFLHTHKICRLG